MRGSERGVTLVDTMIATAIVVVILGVAYPGFKVANETIATSSKLDRTERAGDTILKRVEEEIRAGLVTAVTAPPLAPSLTITRPQTGIALDEITEDGTVPWQVTSTVIRFVQSGLLKEKDLDEDLNRDGDMNDSFAVGMIEVVEDGSARPIMQRAQVILGMPNYTGDLDGDGQGDPLFVKNPRSVDTRIFLIDRDDRGHLLRADVHGTVHLRNVQE